MHVYFERSDSYTVTCVSDVHMVWVCLYEYKMYMHHVNNVSSECIHVYVHVHVHYRAVFTCVCERENLQILCARFFRE